MISAYLDRYYQYIGEVVSEEDAVNAMARNISYDNLQETPVFLNEDGDLCAAGRIYTATDEKGNEYLINLSTYILYVRYKYNS